MLDQIGFVEAKSSRLDRVSNFVIYSRGTGLGEEGVDEQRENQGELGERINLTFTKIISAQPS